MKYRIGFKYLFVATFLFLMAIITERLSHVESLSFGKDDGLVFKIVATSIIGAILYAILKKQFSTTLLLNVFIGFSGYIISYLLDLMTSFIVYQNKKAMINSSEKFFIFKK